MNIASMKTQGVQERRRRRIEREIARDRLRSSLSDYRKDSVKMYWKHNVIPFLLLCDETFPGITRSTFPLEKCCPLDLSFPICARGLCYRDTLIKLRYLTTKTFPTARRILVNIVSFVCQTMKKIFTCNRILASDQISSRRLTISDFHNLSFILDEYDEFKLRIENYLKVLIFECKEDIRIVMLYKNLKFTCIEWACSCCVNDERYLVQHYFKYRYPITPIAFHEPLPYKKGKLFKSIDFEIKHN